MNPESWRPIADPGVRAVVSALCLIAGFTGLAIAESPAEADDPSRQVAKAASAESIDSSVATSEGMRAFVDPDTGALVSAPTRPEVEPLSAPLAKALSRSTESLRVFDLANGGRGVHLAGRFQHALVVRVRPDGSLETVCTNHVHSAEALLHGKAAGVEPQPRDR